MLMTFMEEEQFIMNKKKRWHYLLQVLFFSLAFYFSFSSEINRKHMETIKLENESLKEQIQELELELKEEKEESTSGLSKPISYIKEELNEKEKQMKKLENEIRDLEEMKSKWNRQIAELEK